VPLVLSAKSSDLSGVSDFFKYEFVFFHLGAS
jgi:hypothetical protein